MRLCQMYLHCLTISFTDTSTTTRDYFLNTQMMLSLLPVSSFASVRHFSSHSEIFFSILTCLPISLTESKENEPDRGRLSALHNAGKQVSDGAIVKTSHSEKVGERTERTIIQHRQY